MDEQAASRKRRISPWIPGIFVALSLTILILLQTSNLWKGLSVETASDTLLLYALSSLNFIAFVIFGFIFLRSLTKLIRERRTLQLGSRIKTRLFLYFAAVSILPIVAMAGFSYLFMNRAIERWFTQIPENVVRNARDLQVQANAEQAVNLRETAAMLAAVLTERQPTSAELSAIAAAGNLTYIELASPDGTVVSAGETDVDANRAGELQETIDAARASGGSAAMLYDGKGFDAAVWSLSDGRRLIIVPDQQPERSVGNLVDASLNEFDRLKDRQSTIRQIGLLTLGVLTFLLIFASSWSAFNIARGLTVPIRALAEGAEEIARGNLSHRVDVFAEDELALLVAAFNEMLKKLEENSALISEGRRYIETVLESLPTGVISLNSSSRVTVINRAASEMLGLSETDVRGSKFLGLVHAENRETLERIVLRAFRVGVAADQITLKRSTAAGEGTVPAAITATALEGRSGVVLVIEDLTELLAAQRASAWREVARRMAHEIKNPLTPIQLSAERIARRFIHDADPQAAVDPAAGIVRDGTATILREVSSLKAMVDEFTRFARLPEAELRKGNLNEIVRQVAALYEDRLPSAELVIELDARLPDSLFDDELLKRVFVNLIDNAVEAFADDASGNRVTIRTRFDEPRDRIIAEVTDNGRGISPGDLGKLFQPYFSTKERGTGLGLAIVQRIISEHGGVIRAVNNNGRGSRFIVELPAGV